MKALLACLAAVAIPLGAQGQPALVLSRTIALPEVSGAFNHHSADAKRHRLYLCASTSQLVEVVDLRSGRVIESIPGGKPSAVCYIPAMDLIAVSRGDKVELYSAVSFARVAAVTMPASIDELRFDDASGQLFAGGMSPSEEGVIPIDLAARRPAKELKTGTQPQAFAVEDGGHRVFVCTPRSGQVTVVDRTSDTVAAWKLPLAGQGDYPIAFDSLTHRLFVGCRHPGELSVFDTDTGRVVAEVGIGNDTDDLSWDAANRRVYVACGEGIVSVVQQDDPNHYRNIQTVKTAPGARNCGFLPETSEFFVTVPQRPGQPAAVLVYQARSH